MKRADKFYRKYNYFRKKVNIVYFNKIKKKKKKKKRKNKKPSKKRKKRKNCWSKSQKFQILSTNKRRRLRLLSISEQKYFEKFTTERGGLLLKGLRGGALKHTWGFSVFSLFLKIYSTIFFTTIFPFLCIFL